jgi:hypothetical protein
MTTSFQTATRQPAAVGGTSAGFVARPRWRAALAAGLMVGFAECLLFALDLARLPIQTMIWRQFGFGASQAVPQVGTLLAFVAPVVAGCSFALLAGGRARRAPWWRIGLSGASLLAASTVGFLVAVTLEPVANRLDDSGRLMVFRVSFVLASGIASLVCTWSVAMLLRAPNPIRYALSVAAVTAATYLVFLLLIDLLPGWHVGGGDKAMPRIAMVGNLLAGAVGGWLAFQLLQDRVMPGVPP